MLRQLEGKMDERVAALDQKCLYLEKKSKEGVEHTEGTVSELLAASE